MRGENIVRIIAVIGLCALVYYFSFDQGRLAVEGKVTRLKETLAAKDRLIETMSEEIRRLKARVTELEAREEAGPAEPTSAGSAEPAGRSEMESPLRVNLRRDSSRSLFENRLILTCLEINRPEKQATLQLNLVRENRVVKAGVKLGQGLSFTLAGQPYKLILDQIHSSFVIVRLIKG